MVRISTPGTLSEWPPSHAAVLSGGEQEVELLLEKNADINIKSDAGQTATSPCRRYRATQALEIPDRERCRPEKQGRGWKETLFYAKQNKHPQTSALLKEYTD